MKNCTISEKLPGAEEYNRLRKMVGWGTYPESVVEESLPNSLYGVCAYQDGELIGMARIIGDGGLVYYIQDVIVIPSFQRQGIGTQLMDRVMEFIGAHASHHAIIGLMSAKWKEPFYEKYGFANRPSDLLGSEMTLFWKVSQSAVDEGAGHKW